MRKWCEQCLQTLRGLILRAGSSGLSSVMLHEFGTEPKVFPPDLWIFRLEEARSSCPAEKKAHRPITHQMCWFSGTAGDRTLDQQAISLPSGRITHHWTGCIRKNKTFLPFKWSLQDSFFSPPRLLTSSLPSHLFLSLPLVMNCSLSFPTFPPLVAFLPWLTGLNPC